MNYFFFRQKLKERKNKCLQTLNYNNTKADLRQLEKSSSCYMYDIGLISFVLKDAFIDFFFIYLKH